MQLYFTKMQGLGNDFVVIDLITQRFNLQPHQVEQIADRHFGIGCDQLLVVEPPSRPEVDFRYRIFNASGEEVEQCGNGARCFAKFVRDKKLTGKNPITVETHNGVIELLITDNQQVQVNMGEPVLTPAKIPFTAEQQAASYPLDVGDQTLEIGAVSMGNPHALTLVDDTTQAAVARLGPVIESHLSFPQRVNAGFMQVISRSEINLRVYERGVGETLACGTGACAAVVSGQLRGLLDPQVIVNLPGGSLQIEWQGQGHPVMMTGPAERVFEGYIHL